MGYGYKMINTFLRNKRCSFWRCKKSCRTLSSVGVSGGLKVMFFGTDDFALESLKMLLNQLSTGQAVKDLSVVYSQQRCAVAQFCKLHNLKTLQWKPSLAEISQTGAQIGLVASFGHLIPSKMISVFPLGMLNVHASILPRWRGAAPIVHAILNNDLETGVTIMKIRPFRFDEGEIVSSATCQIREGEGAPELTKRLATIGAEELRKCLLDLPKYLERAQPQPKDGVTYAPKIDSSMSLCDWPTMTSDKIVLMHQALGHVHPLHTYWQGQSLKLLECKVGTPCSEVPGKIAFDWKQRQLVISCKDNSTISVSKVKLPERHAILAIDFLNGYLKKVDKKLWRFGL